MKAIRELMIAVSTCSAFGVSAWAQTGDVLDTKVVAVFKAKCAVCHDDHPGNAASDVDYLLDFARLADEGIYLDVTARRCPWSPRRVAGLGRTLRLRTACHRRRQLPGGCVEAWFVPPFTVVKGRASLALARRYPGYRAAH